MGQEESRYIDTLVREEMLEDPKEPGIHPLERASRIIEANSFWSGTPCYRRELRPGLEPRYQVNFVPKRSGV